MVARLSKTQKTNIGRLYILSGYIVKQISEKLGVSIYTVRQHLHRRLIKPERTRTYQGPQMADGSYRKVGG